MGRTLTTWMFVLLVALAGCNSPEEKQAASPPAPAPPEIEFSSWPTATETPIGVDPDLYRYCVAPSTIRGTARGGAKRHGPHLEKFIVLRVNPGAMDAFEAGMPLPAGTTVVKEKHADVLAADPPEYGAMVEREPGYDPEHGGWEYVYAVKAENEATRGKLSSCVECHAHAKDHLFRTDLPGFEVADW